MAIAASRISAAFPSLGKEFYFVLMLRVKELGIGDERLLAAVNHVIDTCVYPTPTAAQFLTFDQRVEYLTYRGLIKKNDELNGRAFDFYKRVEVDWTSRPVYASIDDIEMFNLKTK